MTKPQTTIRNLEELDRFVRDFAAALRGGETVGLVGDLGVGKTTFVQHLSRALGVSGPVRSPTFILLQPLATSGQAAIETLCHADAYRLKGFSELEAIGFEDYAGRPDTVTVVEWADRVPEIRELPDYIELKFEFGDRESRIITVSGG